MNIEIAEIPNKYRTITKWQGLLEALAVLDDGKCVKVERITPVDQVSLRSAAKMRGFSLSIRTTPESSFVWVKGKTGRYPSHDRRRETENGQ